MKKRFYTLLFRLTSWLADSTGGFRPVVRWKLALGTLLVGTIAIGHSCRSCYELVVSPPTCYEPVVDSIPQPPDIDSIPPIMCYDPVADPAEEQ